MIRFFIWGIKFTFVILLITFVLLTTIFIYYENTLPNEKELIDYKPSLVSRIYSNDGVLIKEYAKEYRLYVKYDEIPKHIIYAFISAEDKNFFQHPGIDYQSIFRAIIQNILNFNKKNKSLVGASTITQQVVKNLLLTNEKTIERKIKEAILSVKISKKLSKEKILELYLNEIFLGNRSYGIIMASLNYFNKSLEHLSLSEAALLAALPKAPSAINPKRNMSRAISRRNWVLDRMLEEGYANAREVNIAKSLPLYLVKKKEKIIDNSIEGGFFIETLRKKIDNIYGKGSVYKKGFSVISTYDNRIQNYANEAFQENIIKYDHKFGYRGVIASVELSNNIVESIESSEMQDELSSILNNYQKYDQYLSTWSTAIVIETSKRFALLYSARRELGLIPIDNLKWTKAELLEKDLSSNLVKKLDQIRDVLKKGDIIIVSKVKKNMNKNYGLYPSDYKIIAKKLRIYDLNDKEINLKKVKSKINIYNLEQIPLVNGAMVVMEPSTGKVRALIGGFSGQSSNGFNRAVQSKRQPGSILKPFIYLAALKQGLAPNTILIDDEVRIRQADGKYWVPQNYNRKFSGATPLRQGVEKSNNIVSVRLVDSIGFAPIIKILKDFNIYEDPPAYYSMILGSIETSLLKLVNAYSIIANGGKKIQPKLIEKIEDYHGTLLNTRNDFKCYYCNIKIEDDNASSFPVPLTEIGDVAELNNDNNDIFYNGMKIKLPYVEYKNTQLIESQVNYQMISILEGVIKRGTGWRINRQFPSYTIVGKTGTTNNNYDAWFIGFVHDLVVGIYVGYDKPRSLGKYQTGATLASPIFIDFMKRFLKNKKDWPFKIPKNIKFVAIDRHTGQVPNELTKSSDIIYEVFREGNNLPQYEKHNRNDDGAINIDDGFF